MIGRCVDCASWNRNGDTHEVFLEENNWDGESLPHRVCLNIIHGNRDSRSSRKMKESPAAVLDGSGYAASFWTKADFGCTLFVAKEEEGRK